MINEIINVGKIGAKFTECGSWCDRSQLFSNTKFNQKMENVEQVDAPLRTHPTNLLKTLANKNLLKISK